MDLHKKEIRIFSDHLESPAPIFTLSTDEALQYELMDKSTIESRMATLDQKILTMGTGGTVSFDYNGLDNKPDLSIYVEKENGKGLFSGDYNDLTNVPNLDTYVQKEEGKSLFSGDYNDLINIPEDLVYEEDINIINENINNINTNIETINESLTSLNDNKVDKIEGKGLSTEDFTTEEKAKLAQTFIPFSIDVLLDKLLTTTGDFTLDKSMNEYDFILVCGWGHIASTGVNASTPYEQNMNLLIPHDDILLVAPSGTTWTHALHASISGATRRVSFHFPNYNTIRIRSNQGAYVRKIYGIKMPKFITETTN